MSNNEFTIDVVGGLQHKKTKRQINADIRQLEKIINMLRITGMFAKGNTKRELNQYIKEMSEKLNYVKLKGKLDEKSLKREINESLHNMTFKEIDALKVDGNKAKLKMQKVVADMRALAEKTPTSVNVRLKKEKKDAMYTLIAYAFKLGNEYLRDSMLTVLYDKDESKDKRMFLGCFKKSEKSSHKSLESIDFMGFSKLVYEEGRERNVSQAGSLLKNLLPR